MQKHKPAYTRIATLAVFICMFPLGSSLAMDVQNCLICHRHRGLSYIDDQDNLRLLYVAEPVYQNSPHSLLSCLDCHDDINKIPHQTAQKVNCLKECHLEDSGRIRQYSHAEVGEIMAESVHGALDKNGRPKSHSDDYPTCKTCHQDPQYRPLAFFKRVRYGVSEKIMARCLVCHKDKTYIKKFYNHFTSRMQKGRSSREVVNLCSKCHEDASFLDRHNQPHVVHAYWESYHGKAVFFGNELAPDCLDCHAGFGGSVHSMHAKDDPKSTVHPSNRSLVCSDIDCHPNASENLMDFKVHILADKDLHPIEYYVSLFFVIMTLASFIPIMLAAILDVVRIIFPGNTKPEPLTLPARPAVDGVELGNSAPQVVERKGRRYFYHLTLNQRWQHIIMMISFAGLALTGLPMKYLHVSWMEQLYYLLGGIDIATVLHRVFGVIMLLIFLYHFVYIAVSCVAHYLLPLQQAGKLTFGNSLKSIMCLPMVPTIEDIVLLWKKTKYRLFFTNINPAAPRFTIKEKFGYMAVFWGIPVIGLSGIILWGEELFTHILPGNFLNFCLIAHSDEALLAIIVVFLWHLYNTHIKMETFPMGMSWLTGYKSEQEITGEHYGYYRGVMAAARMPAAEPSHRPKSGFALLGKKAGALITLIFLAASTAYLSWLVFYTVFGFHVRSIQHIPEQHHLTKPRFLEELVLDSKDKKNFYRGFRITREQQISDHYHNIELQVAPDGRSHCIKCHGDFPHGKTAQIRSYLNMHAFFLSCQTCHVRPEAGQPAFVYRWYNRETGDILSEMPKLDVADIDTLGIKLIPFRNEATALQRLDSDREIRFAQNLYRDIQNNAVSKEDKTAGIQEIHSRISDKSITCKNCHVKKESLINYATIGYSLERIEHLYANDIISMIDQYEHFYIPSLFKH